MDKKFNEVQFSDRLVVFASKYVSYDDGSSTVEFEKDWLTVMDNRYKFENTGKWYGT